jgi:hypothetical protein
MIFSGSLDTQAYQRVDIDGAIEEDVTISFTLFPDSLPGEHTIFEFNTDLSLVVRDNDLFYSFDQNASYPSSFDYPSPSKYPVSVSGNPETTLINYITNPLEIKISLFNVGGGDSGFEISAIKPNGFIRRAYHSYLNWNGKTINKLKFGNIQSSEEFNFRIENIDIQGFVVSDLYRSSSYHGLKSDGLWQGTNDLYSYTKPTDIRNLARYNYIKTDSQSIPKGIIWSPPE